MRMTSALAAMAVGLAGVALVPVAARAETSTAATTCANPFTGSQAGPSEFTFTVPSTIHTGDTVEVRLTLAVANSSGFPVTDLNTFSMAGATPVPLSAGSQGPVADGASAAVTLTGSWSPTLAGAQTIAASGWTFNTVAFGLTIPVTCAFTAAAPSITRTVTPPPTLVVAPATTEAGRAVRLSGANWSASTAGTVSLCAGTACTEIGKARSNAAGGLCGQVLIPRGTAAGAYAVQVTIGPDTETAALTVVKPRGHKPKPKPPHHR